MPVRQSRSSAGSSSAPVSSSGRRGGLARGSLRPSNRCSPSWRTSCPSGDFLYEPKWDGFRAIVFRGEDDVYHPEPRLAAARSLLSGAARRAARRACRQDCVVDGEIVIATARGLDFDALQLRLHPAASRVDEARERDARLVRRVRRARGRTDAISWTRRRASAACCLEELLAGRRSRRSISRR